MRKSLKGLSRHLWKRVARGGPSFASPNNHPGYMYGIFFRPWSEYFANFDAIKQIFNLGPALLICYRHRATLIRPCLGDEVTGMPVLGAAGPNIAVVPGGSLFAAFVTSSDPKCIYISAFRATVVEACAGCGAVVWDAIWTVIASCLRISLVTTPFNFFTFCRTKKRRSLWIQTNPAKKRMKQWKSTRYLDVCCDVRLSIKLMRIFGRMGWKTFAEYVLGIFLFVSLPMIY